MGGVTGVGGPGKTALMNVLADCQTSQTRGGGGKVVPPGGGGGGGGFFVGGPRTVCFWGNKRVHGEFSF